MWTRTPSLILVKTVGTERLQIVYGAKVIKLVNTDPRLYWNRHRKVYPAKDDAYIANGEIGMAIGYYWRNEDRKNGLDSR